MSLNPQESRKRRRERIAIVLILVLFLLFTFLEIRLSRVSDSLPFVNSIFFFGLLNINVILLIALFWLIFRNVGKLFWERRNKVLGARLKTKLVAAFFMFSIIPTLILFVISSAYINSSFDKWFSIRVQNTLQASLDVTRSFYRSTDTSTKHFAKSIAADPLLQLKRGDQNPVVPLLTNQLKIELEKRRETLAVNAIEFYADALARRILVSEKGSRNSPRSFPRLPFDVLSKSFRGEHLSFIQHLKNGDLIRATSPVVDSKTNRITGVIAVNTYIPVSLVNKVDEIANVIDDYRLTNPLQYPIKTTYFVILILITLVVIAVAIWVGLYLARELTVPIEQLAKGARAVGSGNLDIQIPVTGHDEIAALIKSFNKMTHHLKDNQEKLTQASKDLETRRIQLEAILDNIGAGVIVVDRHGKIISFNPAASKLLEIPMENANHQSFLDLLKGKADELVSLIQKSLEQKKEPNREEIYNTQWTIKTKDQSRNLAAIVTLLRDRSHAWGAIVVIDDMTHLLKAQREVAWREVARRIAHEIKNPLTPIKLSAQRIQRRFGSWEGKSGEILNECTETIVKHTDELKEMVNEFSNFARFPAITPESNHLNTAILEVLNLYTQAHPDIDIELALQKGLPQFEFDKDQIKRVVRNLIENSVATLKSSHLTRSERKIRIETHYNDRLHIALISVEDNGLGMKEEVLERVFEPYFSTKKEGTGLGLAIAKRIVNDHDGFIRVTSQEGQGTKFWIELPTQPRQELKREWTKLNENQNLDH